MLWKICQRAVNNIWNLISFSNSDNTSEREEGGRKRGERRMGKRWSQKESIKLKEERGKEVTERADEKAFL